MNEARNCKLGSYIRKINLRLSDLETQERLEVFGVTNKEGVVNTGVPPSDDLSNYIIVKGNQFVYNPYRVNVGSIGLTPKDLKGLVSPAYVVFETNNELDSEYLFLYLKSERGINLINHYGNRGGVRDALRYDALSEIDFPFVDLPTQKAIVARLQALHALHREANDTLARLKADVKRLRQSILQDAIQGKLTDNQPAPGEKTGAELLADIRAEKERRARAAGKKPEAPLPPVAPEEMPFEVPEGWVWCRLGEVTNEVFDGPFGSNLKTADYTTKGVQVIRLENIGVLTFNEQKETFISFEKYESLKKHTIYKGDILFSSFLADGVRTVVIPELQHTSIAKADCFCIRVNEKIMDRHFLVFALSSNLIYEELATVMHGMTRFRVNSGQLKNLLIPVPSLQEQKTISQEIQSRLAQCDQFDQQLTALQTKTERLWKSELQQTFKFDSNG